MRAIYLDSRPFSAVADNYWQIMVECEFANFTRPARQPLANKPIDHCYDEVKTEARVTWVNEDYINTIMDESIWRFIGEPLY